MRAVDLQRDRLGVAAAAHCGAPARGDRAVFATVISLMLLKEPFNRSVLVAVALATAGSMLIRLG